MRKLGLRVTGEVRGTFADTAKLLDLRKSGGVVTTKAVVTLCVTYDERYKGVEHNGMDCSVVPQISSETMLLRPQKTGFFEDKLDLHVSLIEG